MKYWQTLFGLTSKDIMAFKCRKGNSAPGFVGVGG